MAQLSWAGPTDPPGQLSSSRRRPAGGGPITGPRVSVRLQSRRWLAGTEPRYLRPRQPDEAVCRAATDVRPLSDGDSALTVG